LRCARFGSRTIQSPVNGGSVPRSDSANRDVAHSGYRSRSAYLLVVIFLVSAASIALFGRLYYQSQRSQLLKSKGEELASIRDLKIDQIDLWRTGLLRDGRSFSSDPTLKDELTAWLKDPQDPAATAALRGWMSLVVGKRDYSHAILISADGRNWLSPDGSAAPDATSLKEARAARGSTEATLTDLFLDPETSQPRIDLIVPLPQVASQTEGTPIQT